jgi:two-component system, cell cycle response regulator
MPTILTVDDSRAIRMIVSKEIVAMGFAVDEAEDGVQGLAKLESAKFDLVILDVTMPVMDGPAMLAKMRERGDLTPVLMLTSESKRSIVSDLMKLKIADYILKPFKSDELRKKILRSLNLPADEALGVEAAARQVGGGNPVVALPTAAASSAPESKSAPGSAPDVGEGQAGHVLVIDDMDNVQKRLRALVPAHLSLHSAPTGQAGIASCRERSYRLVLIDHDLNDINIVSLLKQVRVLQPASACVAMALRSTSDLSRQFREEGFDDTLYKPFKTENVEDLIERHFESGDNIDLGDNVLSVRTYVGRPDRIDRYYLKLGALVKDAVQKVADACFECIILDAGCLPPSASQNAQLIQTLAQHGQKMGLRVCVVGTPELAKGLKAFTETADIQVLSTLDEALAQAA